MAVSAVVESVFNTILEQLTDEVGALLGTPLELSEHRMQVLNKEDLFSISRGRSVLSTMVVSGDKTGEAFIISDLKDSVVLGGTLIMLPKDQIEENCKLRTFEGEAADAYGEVANIIAGVYTSVFLDMYPENLHFKRTTVADFIPAQLDPAADHPFPPGEYFHSSCRMILEGFDLHNLEVIVPAELLGLGSAPQPQPAAEPVVQSATVSPQETAELLRDTEPIEEEAPAPSPEPATTQEPVKYVDQATADRTLRAAITQCADEVGGMLGLELELDDISLRYVSKQEYFSRPGKKAVSTEMLISGDNEGCGYFIVDLRDAIFFGGTMIMLPSVEVEKLIQAGEFNEDVEDAFGEVANIVSGGLVQNFDEMYPRNLHLKRGEMSIFTPTKVKIEDATPFPDGEYYQVSASMTCEASDLGTISFLCPPDVLHIKPRPVETGWGAAAEEPAAKPAPAATPSSKPAAQEPAAASSPQAPAENKEQVVVIVGDDPTLNSYFADSIGACQQTTLQFNTGDSFNSLRQYIVIGAFLLMESVDEKAFGHMIKLRSEIPAKQPLIVAGPQWTRSDVLKAVRYGASDIILTPASEAEIKEKVASNLKTTCH